MESVRKFNASYAKEGQCNMAYFTHRVVQLVSNPLVDSDTQGQRALAGPVRLNAAGSREGNDRPVPVAEIPGAAALERFLQQIGRFRIVLYVVKEATDSIESVTKDRVAMLMKHHAAHDVQCKTDDHERHVLFNTTPQTYVSIE